MGNLQIPTQECAPAQYIRYKKKLHLVQNQPMHSYFLITETQGNNETCNADVIDNDSLYSFHHCLEAISAENFEDQAMQIKFKNEFF